MPLQAQKKHQVTDAFLVCTLQPVSQSAPQRAGDGWAGTLVVPVASLKRRVFVCVGFTAGGVVLTFGVHVVAV
jgi:hypothetical protein